MVGAVGVVGGEPWAPLVVGALSDVSGWSRERG